MRSPALLVVCLVLAGCPKVRLQGQELPGRRRLRRARERLPLRGADRASASAAPIKPAPARSSATRWASARTARAARPTRTAADNTTYCDTGQRAVRADGPLHVRHPVRAGAGLRHHPGQLRDRLPARRRLPGDELPLRRRALRVHGHHAGRAGALHRGHLRPQLLQRRDLLPLRRAVRHPRGRGGDAQPVLQRLRLRSPAVLRALHLGRRHRHLRARARTSASSTPAPTRPTAAPTAARARRVRAATAAGTFGWCSPAGSAAPPRPARATPPCPAPPTRDCQRGGQLREAPGAALERRLRGPVPAARGQHLRLLQLPGGLGLRHRDLQQGECTITRRKCVNDDQCSTIRCVDFEGVGACLIGQNCTPSNGLTCVEVQ